MSLWSQLVEEVFSEAVELPVHERESYVEERCGDDDEARQNVMKLLNDYARSERENFILERPDTHRNGLPNDSSFVPSELVGETIDRYRLLKQIGEGGMGVVYMAEQVDDIKRRVAMKIIKLGMDTKQVIARFEAERQAMAMFDHPNITRVFDAGNTQTGRPYFVMELVNGVEITRYAKEESLTLESRLKLFLDVCDAIQHAHHKGIIHRDLKPSNVLVSEIDGKAIPKVIDFGIAKAVGFNLTDKTLFTRHSAIMGTPQYMSPEQAKYDGVDVDTRSDVYSLGVLLYELITDTTPLSAERLTSVSPLALYETLRDTHIDRPSTRIANTSYESVPQTIFESEKRIRGELDWVTMKALARKRSERYATANELAADVRRFLNGEPVQATAPSRVQYFRAFARKYRTQFTIASLVATTLLVAVVVSTMFAVRAHRLSAETANANERLSDLNSQLTETNSKLAASEQEKRQRIERRNYGDALTATSSRFYTRLAPDAFGIAQSLFPEQLKDYSLSSFMTEPPEDFPLAFGCSVVEIFEDHPHVDLLSRQFSNSFCRNREVDTRRWKSEKEESESLSGLPFSDEFIHLMFGDDEYEYSPPPEYQLHREEVKKFVRENYLPVYFEILVEEQTRVFGENAPQVSDGLELLAASLIELGEYSKAETALNDSISIRRNCKDPDVDPELLDISSAQELLKLIEDKRVSRSDTQD